MSNEKSVTEFMKLVQEVLEDIRENGDSFTSVVPSTEEINFHYESMNNYTQQQSKTKDIVEQQESNNRVVMSEQDLRYSLCTSPEKRLEIEARILGL